MALRENELHRTYSYAEYRKFPEEEQWELIEGMPISMSPAPSPKHQDIVGQLYRKFSDFLEETSCRVFIAPFDVRLFADNKKDEEIRNVVQPDVSIICDPAKIDDYGCKGSPNLIVEVLSPATAKKDRLEKKRLYREAEVREYWIVDPTNETVEVFLLEGAEYIENGVYSKVDSVSVRIFDNLTIELQQIFRL
jgi:Uma2 family endonuclease